VLALAGCVNNDDQAVAPAEQLPPASETEGSVVVVEEDAGVVEAEELANAQINGVKEVIKEAMEPPTIDHIASLVEPTDLVGAWKVGAGDFEEIMIEENGIYSTFLHDRPFDSGEWSLDEDGNLILESDADETLNDFFRMISFDGSKLILNEGKVEVTWTLIK